MKINAEIDILIGRDGTTINIHDVDASIMFLTIKLSPQQLSDALSRFENTETLSCEIRAIDRIGKHHECKQYIFEVPFSPWEEKINLFRICEESMVKDGYTEWNYDTHFSSRDSFFTRDGKNYAMTTIRRWVDKEEP